MRNDELTPSQEATLQEFLRKQGLVQVCEDAGALLAKLELVCREMQQTGDTCDEVLETLRDHAAAQMRIIERALAERKVGK